MKHLCSIHGRQEAEDLVTRFEMQGIPLILSNVDSNRLVMGTAMTIDVWVGLESQMDEAAALLKDPDYLVQHPVDPIAFHQQLAKLKNAPNAFPNKAFNYSVYTVLLVLLLWVMWTLFGS